MLHILNWIKELFNMIANWQVFSYAAWWYLLLSKAQKLIYVVAVGQ